MFQIPCTATSLLGQRTKQCKEVKVRRKNALGAVVFKSSLSLNNSTPMQLPEIASGVYHYQIIAEDGKAWYGKLTIAK